MCSGAMYIHDSQSIVDYFLAHFKLIHTNNSTGNKFMSYFGAKILHDVINSIFKEDNKETTLR